MNWAVKQVVGDRIAFLEDDLAFPELMCTEDAETLQAELDNLRAELAADVIGDETREVVRMYEGRDAYTDNAKWRRAVNRAFAEAGLLRKPTPDQQFLGDRPKTMQYKGEQYFTAV